MTKHDFLYSEHVGDHESGDVSFAAAVMGRKGGSVKSERKAAAVRQNGRKGGRPRKTALWCWYYCDSIKGEAANRREACRKLAHAMGRASLRGMRTAEGGGDETYYYETQAAKDADGDGAHTPCVYPQPDDI